MAGPSGPVAAIDPAVRGGALDSQPIGQFSTDLAAALGPAQLGAGHAVLFTPELGDQANRTFLVIDANGEAGYQANVDMVIWLTAPQNLTALGTGDFI